MTPSQRLSALLVQPLDVERRIGWREVTLVSWPEWSDRARRWQAAFERLAEPRIALHFNDGIEFAAALFGLWQAGKQAWLAGDLTAATQAALGRHVSHWAGDGASVNGLARIQPDVAARPVSSVPLDAEREALVVFTSGSTGAPEACVKRLRQLFAEIDALEEAFGATAPGCTVIASVSPQHVYGLLFRVLWPLATGRLLQARSIVYMEELEDLVPRGGRAVLITSPTHLGRLPLAVPEAAARVDQVFSSGAPLSDAALADTRRIFGSAPIEVYGSTETGGVAWRQRGPDATAAWHALPGVRWRLEDEQLMIRSPHLATTGWMPSSDRAVAVKGGFELRGRKDRIVKIAEKRISLQTVEDRLLHGGLLAMLRLVMLDGPRPQLGVVAVPSAQGWALHDRAGRRALAEALRAQLLDVVDRVALPRRWRFLPELPRNAQGKSTQASLQAAFDPRRPAVREIARDGGDIALTLLVDAGLPQFEGHFRGLAVLPGVAQLDWALMFGQECFGIAGEFVGMEAVKFHRVVVPGMRLTLVLTWQPSGRLIFRYQSAVGMHASGRLLFGGSES